MTVADTILAVGTEHKDDKPPGMILYHWGGLSVGGSLEWLVNHGDDQASFRQRYDQEQGADAKAGAGLYLSDNLYDAADYCKSDMETGVLVQAKIGANVPYVDMTDRNTKNQLKDKTKGRASVTMNDVYKLRNRTPVLMKYQDHWFVLKTCNDVEFKLMDGTDQAVYDIAQAIPFIRAKSKFAFAALVRQLDDGVKDGIGEKLLE